MFRRKGKNSDDNDLSPDATGLLGDNPNGRDAADDIPALPPLRRGITGIGLPDPLNEAKRPINDSNSSPAVVAAATKPAETSSEKLPYKSLEKPLDKTGFAATSLSHSPASPGASPAMSPSGSAASGTISTLGANNGTGVNNSSASSASSFATAPRRPAVPSLPVKPESNDSKRLIVGRDICLQGEITSCDILVVEGRVEASLSARIIEITDTGIFKGSAEIDHAEIAGRFEGSLTVRDRLLIRATGKIVGTVHYHRVEVELGGEVAGEMKVIAGHAGSETIAAE